MIYFSYRLNREVGEIYWESVLASLALSLVFIFEPIYLLSLGYSFVQIMWFYLLVYVGYVLLAGFGAKFASRFGYKHSIFVSNIFYVVYWLVLFSIKNYPVLFFVAPLLFALQKSWFWPAYHADVALFAPKKQRGREVGMLYSLMQVASIAGPVLGGLLSQAFGFFTLFVTAAVLMVVSVYPLFRSPEIKTRHNFQFRNLWRILRREPSAFFGYWGFAEDLMLMSLWPIYMFMIVPSVLNVGIITTIATLIGTVLMLYLGRLIDTATILKTTLIRFTSIGYGLSWIFRFLGRSTLGILGFDTLTKIGKNILQVPLMSLEYEKAGRHDPDRAIAYAVFFEFSLSVGKIITALGAIAILSSGGSIFGVFALAGVLTMLYGFMK